MSLPVSPGARLTAACIADHINQETGRWDLSAVQIAAETGRKGKFADRAVRRHVNDELRAFFGVEDRPGRSWAIHHPGANDADRQTFDTKDKMSGHPGQNVLLT